MTTPTASLDVQARIFRALAKSALKDGDNEGYIYNTHRADQAEAANDQD